MTDPSITVRLERGAEHLHRLGAPAIAELLAEVGDRIGGIPCIVSLLTEYERRITPNYVAYRRWRLASAPPLRRRHGKLHCGGDSFVECRPHSPLVARGFRGGPQRNPRAQRKFGEADAQ